MNLITEALTVNLAHPFPDRHDLPYFHNPYYRFPIQARLGGKAPKDPTHDSFVLVTELTAASLWQHCGDPFDLQTGDVIRPESFYLDVEIRPNNFNDFNILRRFSDEARSLADFLTHYPGIEWLIGTTWLTSVRNGRLVTDNGFHISPVCIPNITTSESKRYAQRKINQTRRYRQRILGSKVSLVYARSTDFIDFWRN